MCWGLNERPRVSYRFWETHWIDAWPVTSGCPPGALCPATTAERPSDRGMGICSKIWWLRLMGLLENVRYLLKNIDLFFLGGNIWDKIWWQSMKKINWILGWVLDNWENHSFPMALWCLTIFHDHKVGVMSAMSVTFRLFGPNSFTLPARALHFGFVFEVLYRVLNWKLHFYLVRIVNTGNTDLNELERTLHVLNMQTMI